MMKGCARWDGAILPRQLLIIGNLMLALNLNIFMSGSQLKQKKLPLY